ncbi:MAG: glycogen debranching enzyme, partial [Chloroflexi bacterium]|nr:glycogen debranching enzyme [Chloroflexota bacterium]
MIFPNHHSSPKPLQQGRIRRGSPLPLGVRLRGDGANFAIFSRNASRVWLEFYDNAEDDKPCERIELSPEQHRTGDIWHVWVQGVQPGQLYAYRMDGPYQPQQGHRFNRHKLLLDPYATAITRKSDWDFHLAHGYDLTHPLKDLAPSTIDNAGAMPKCVFTHEHFDWEDDRPLRLPWHDLVIYETHVRGFTIHPSAGVAHPGTYQGMIEKIPYLQDLGITAVELMPVPEFNEQGLDQVSPLSGERLRNYWGYDPVSWMAPKASYASNCDRGQQTIEFKEMVRAYHQAGIEVFLDIVLNHTAEGNELGPTLNLRGIDNSIYYMLTDDKRTYRNFTGTGNTINANHPVVRDIILDVLRYWVMEMHIDGFRFDLASVLGRDEDGSLLANAP